MNNYDLKILKKKYGENFAKLCRSLFPEILEKEGELSNIITEKFAENRMLYDDIVSNNLENTFKNYIYKFSTIKKTEAKVSNKNPYELMEEAGYTLYECHSYEDTRKFSKYFAYDEMLCTFRDRNRIENNHVFFAVKHNADRLNRWEFKNPLRQDEYGTSVISLQFSRGTPNTYFITNRYNHSVANPNATFSNDLENIKAGLTSSFEKEFGFEFEGQQDGLEIPNYVKTGIGKLYKYNLVVNRQYFGVDNVVIDHFGGITEYNKDKYLMFDDFLLDLEEKRIEKISGKHYYDSFVEDFESIEKIEVNKKGDGKLITLTPKNGKDFYIELDKNNSMIKYTNENTTKVGYNYLTHSNKIQEINLPNAQEIGENFLAVADNIKSINFPSAKIIRKSFMTFNESLEEFRADNLEEVEDYFLRNNSKITEISFPKLVKMGKSFMYYNRSMRSVNLPSLEVEGVDFLRMHPNREKFVNSLNINKTQEEIAEKEVERIR